MTKLNPAIFQRLGTSSSYYTSISQLRKHAFSRDNARISSDNFIYFLFIIYIRNYRYRDVIDVAETELRVKRKCLENQKSIRTISN